MVRSDIDTVDISEDYCHINKTALQNLAGEYISLITRATNFVVPRFNLRAWNFQNFPVGAVPNPPCTFWPHLYARYFTVVPARRGDWTPCIFGRSYSETNLLTTDIIASI